MQARGWSRTVGQRCGKHFHAVRPEAESRICAMPPRWCGSPDRSAACANRARPCRRLRFCPEDALHRLAGCQGFAEFNVTPSLRNAVRLTRIHADQAAVRGQGGIVGVDRVEREIESRRQMDDFRSCRLQLGAKLCMLRLCGGEVGSVKKPQFRQRSPGRDCPSRLRSASRPARAGGFPPWNAR